MFKRFRRLRLNDTLRNLVQETTISKDDFIYPLFVREGKGIKTEISSMPGVFQMSIDEILKECEYLQKIGLNSIILFAIPDIKDSVLIPFPSLTNSGYIKSSLLIVVS
jgi:porphobilinogen synthase